MIPSWKAVSIVTLLMLSTSIVAAQTYSDSKFTPLKQFKSGIIQDDIQCKQGFQLILKSENNYPVCVKPQTAEKLVERGWASPVSSYTSNSYTDTSFTSQATYLIATSPQVVVTHVSSTMPGMIKIVSVGTNPGMLKVGDQATFSVTFLNVSNKPIYLRGNCASPPLSYTIYPTSNVVQYPSPRIGCPTLSGVVEPNQTYTIQGVSHPLLGYYKITDAGLSTVNAKLNLFDDYSGKKIVETIQFDLIVIDSKIPNHQT
jgi:hypothetical protein